MAQPVFSYLRRWTVPASICAAATSRDRRWLALACADGRVALKSTEDDGEPPRLMPLWKNGPCSIGPDADGHAFLAVGDEGALQLVEPGLPIPTPLWEGAPSPPGPVATSPLGLRAFATATTVTVLTPEGLPLGAPIPMVAPVLAMAFHPTRPLLAVGDEKNLTLFDLSDGPKEKEKRPCEKPLRALFWDDPGNNLYAAPEQGAPLSFSPDLTATPLPLGEASSALPCALLSLDATGQTLLAAQEERLFYWDLKAPHLPPRRALDAKGPALTALAPHPKEPLLAVGFADGSLALVPLDGRREILLLPTLAAQGASARGFAWNPSGDALHAALENGLLLLFTRKSIMNFVRNAHMYVFI